MNLALQNANVRPEQLTYINAHATSTPAGDLAEITAIKRLFKSQEANENKIYISSVKGSLGHLLGAAGAAETILTILACKERVLPPSINLKNIDPQFKLDEVSCLRIVQNEKLILDSCLDESKRIIALKNSFGFGGTNVSLCLSNFVN